MIKQRNQDPLHGLTLKVIVTQLVQTYGWQTLGEKTNLKCFINDPSISSSLKFLRKTPWAREKVEQLFLTTQWPKPQNNPYKKNLPKK